MSKILDIARHLAFGHLATAAGRPALRKALEKALPDGTAEEVREHLDGIDQTAQEIVRQEEDQLTDEVARGHLELAALVLAIYRSIRPHLTTEEEAVKIIGDSLLEVLDTQLSRWSLDKMLDWCRNRPDRLQKVLTLLMQQYGPSFVSKMTGDEDSTTMTIEQCFYFRFFEAHGVPRLTPALCRLDGLWFNRIEPERHQLKFDYEGYETMGYGAVQCTFRVLRA
jgi:hypothetical protein